MKSLWARYSRYVSHTSTFHRHTVISLAFFLAPSMFGRDLIEQVHADARGSGRTIPIIVEKCLEAVEASGEFRVLALGGTSSLTCRFTRPRL